MRPEQTRAPKTTKSHGLPYTGTSSGRAPKARPSAHHARWKPPRRRRPQHVQPLESPYTPPRGTVVLGEIKAKSGLPSADRNNKATLLLTGPFRTAKSSAKDLTPLVLKLQYAKYRDTLRVPRKNRLLRR